MNRNLLHPVPLHQQHALSRKRSYEGYTEPELFKPLEVRPISSTKRHRPSKVPGTLDFSSNQNTPIPTPFNTYQATPPLDYGGVNTPPNSINNYGGSFFPKQAPDVATAPYLEDPQNRTRMDGSYLESTDAVVPPSPVSDDGGLGGPLGRLYVCPNEDMDVDMSVEPTPRVNILPRNAISGTQAPRLRMGFKADCEKCQARVPGHYSHFY